MKLKKISSLVSALGIITSVGLTPNFGTVLLADTLSFLPKVDYPVGSYPGNMQISDINRDSKLDLATASTTIDGNYTASILLGKGDGSFQPKVDYITSGYTSAVRIGDLNRDGKPDLVTASWFGSRVSALLGNGNGTFKARVDYPASGPYDAEISDLNHDGKPDLVTVSNGGTVSVLLGKGNGTFKTKVDYPTGSGPQAMQIGDLNHDGDSDLVTANSMANTVSILLGNGNGTFQAKVDYSTDSSPITMQIVDVNRDGKPDLITRNYGGHTVSVLLGKGDGTFQTKVDYPTGSGGPGTMQPGTMQIGDLNRDGKPDLVTVNNIDTVSVLLGKGDGTFQAKVDYPTSNNPQTMQISDMNRDGKPDLVIVNNIDTASTVSVLLGKGNGTFQAKVDYPAGNYASKVQIGDLNRDGKPDLISMNINNVSVLLNNGH
jgi:hypothetical protein